MKAGPTAVGNAEVKIQGRYVRPATVGPWGCMWRKEIGAVGIRREIFVGFVWDHISYGAMTFVLM